MSNMQVFFLMILYHQISSYNPHLKIQNDTVQTMATPKITRKAYSKAKH